MKRAVASIDQTPLKGPARETWQDALLARAKNRTQNHLLRVLFDYARGKADCFPSKEAIAGKMGADPKTVYRHLKVMAEAGLIALVKDGSIKVGRRIVFPSHPHAEDVLVQFPGYMQGGQNALGACTCTKGKNHRCTQGILTRCTQGILPPESSIRETQEETEYSPTPPPLSTSPAQRASGARRGGGGKKSCNEFVERCVDLLGPRCQSQAAAAAEVHPKDRLLAAVAAAERREARSWAYVAACLADPHLASPQIAFADTSCDIPY